MKKAFLLSAILASQFAAMAQTAKVQVIHNCADAAADSVDVYLGATKILDNFAFRTATPFIDAPAGVPITLGVAPKNSTGPTDTIYSVTVTLSSANKYVLVANGLVSATGYSPSASVQPFRLSVCDMARLTATTPGNTDILVAHGCTDAPVVDVKAGAATLVNNVAFGQFNSAGYFSVPEANYTLDVTDSTGGTVVKRYSAPLGTLNLGDSAITVVASGFLNPSVNSNGPAFGLWVALRMGGALVQLPEVTTTAVNEVAERDAVKVYPNPATDAVNVVSGAPMRSVVLADITGKIIATRSSVHHAQFSTANLAQGLYIVSCTSNDGTVTNFRVTVQ